MRRAIPIIIIVVAAIALFLNFWPNLELPRIGDPEGGSRSAALRLGLDLQGGIRVEYQAQPAGGRTPTSGDLGTIKTIIENRVNSQGVSEPIVQTVGSDRIVVELPGVENPDEVRKLLQQTGRLDFVPLPAAEYGNSTSPGPKSLNEGDALPAGLAPLFGGEELDDAYATVDSAGGRAVGFRLKATGAAKFEEYTTQHVGEFFAIVLDGKVVSAPSIREPIAGGQGQITGGGAGGFTNTERNNLVTILKYGSLPFPVKELSYTGISATLGLDFLRQAIIAGIIGIGAVFMFMLVYYRLPGLVADFALILYTLIVLAIFRLVPVTLTLAGVAGFVLSIGMAVDANVLIFERTREELRSGKTLVSAVEAGFNRAWNSILDSNVSSLITATILYLLGSSVIRGFALVLIIGVAVSMFSAITVTRTILRGIVHLDAARQARLWGVSEADFTARAATRRPVRGEARGRV